MVTVYMIEFPNGKVYVGITNNMAKRKKQHSFYAKNGSTYPVHNAMRKCGYQIDFKEVARFDNREDACREEMRLIQENKHRAYNITPGGDIAPNAWRPDNPNLKQLKEKASKRLRDRYLSGWKPPKRKIGVFKHTEASKIKMSESKRKISDKTRQLMSNSKKGKRPWNYGKRCISPTIEVRDKISKALKAKEPKRTINVTYPNKSTKLLAFKEIVALIFNGHTQKARKAVYEKQRWREYKFELINLNQT